MFLEGQAPVNHVSSCVSTGEHETRSACSSAHCKPTCFQAKLGCLWAPWMEAGDVPAGSRLRIHFSKFQGTNELYAQTSFWESLGPRSMLGLLILALSCALCRREPSIPNINAKASRRKMSEAPASRNVFDRPVVHVVNAKRRAISTVPERASRQAMHRRKALDQRQSPMSWMSNPSPPNRLASNMRRAIGSNCMSEERLSTRWPSEAYFYLWDGGWPTGPR